MSFPFIVQQRINPKDMHAAPRFYPIAKMRGELSLGLMAQRVATFSTFNPADVLSILESFLQAVSEETAKGYIVRLDQFGSFYLSVNGTGETQPEKVTADNIHSAQLNFRPGQSLANLVQELEFIRCAP
jgi:predicted histone-like DNA-binding protein